MFPAPQEFSQEKIPAKILKPLGPKKMRFPHFMENPNYLRAKRKIFGENSATIGENKTGERKTPRV